MQIKNRIKSITSVFPPTTTAATTSMLSGLNPNEHGWLGWDLYFKKEDLFKSDTIESYIQRCKNFLKLYNYFNDLHKKGENPPKRKELEKQFYDEFVEWEYEQKKHYDVEYYI